MQRSVAIFLMCVFLFNVIGYYGVYAGLRHRANSNLARAIDNDTYDKTQTITIKIPLVLPYPTNGEVERLSGDFEYLGEFYKLLQQKYENDTVHVTCLRSEDHKNAGRILHDLVERSTDQSSAPNQNTKTLGGMLKDYNPVFEVIRLREQVAFDVKKQFASVDAKVLVREYPVATPPPNFSC